MSFRIWTVGAALAAIAVGVAVARYALSASEAIQVALS